MSNLKRLQDRLRDLGCHGLIVPSTDEYLSEWTQPHLRRLEWATGFSGSVGLAIVLQDRAALFVDGRYVLQARQQIDTECIEVHDVGKTPKVKWLSTSMERSQCLALDTRLHSQPDIEQILAFAETRGITIAQLRENPIDQLWGLERPPPNSAPIFHYPVQFAGLSLKEKRDQLREWMHATGSDYHLLADPEDVAWLLNIRTHDSLNGTADHHIVPVPLTRALLGTTGRLSWFVSTSRFAPNLVEQFEDEVEIVPPERFESFLEECAKGRTVSCNVLKTPHRFAAIVARAGTLRNDPIVARQRWKKHPNEIQSARDGHYLDGQVMIRFMAWLQRTVGQRSVTELEASQKLWELRGELLEYKGSSMPLMSASGLSGALPHYVPSAHSNRVLNEHPIYWVDSGAQYYGCSTDNTVCLALGKPEPRHVHAHTLVLKGFIALCRTKFPEGILSTQLDSFARQFLWQAGMDYAHGTGHGVGNFMNIHEGPAIRKDPSHPLVVPMERGMIVSNEPAYYAEGDFGIRIESHLVSLPSSFEGFLEFEVLSRLPIDPKLVDPSLLTGDELRWLAAYHARIFEGYEGCFDEETSSWLRGVVDGYRKMIEEDHSS